MYETLKSVCEKYGKSITKVMDEAKLSHSLMTGWKNGSTMHMKTIKKLASAIGCSPMELLNALVNEVKER